VTPTDEAQQHAGDGPLASRGAPARSQTIVEARAFGQAAEGPALREGALEQLALAGRDAAALAPAAPDQLQARIDRLLARSFSPQDCAILADLQRLADDGVAVAMAGRLDAAASRFLRANRMMEESALDPRARSLAESLLWAREAESETCAGRYAWAAELLEAAFDRDLEAEAAGLELLLAHRIRLAHVRMRLDRARGRLGEAMLLGAELLHYLERPTEPPGTNLRPAWRRGWRDHRGLIDALAADLHRQVAQDQVALLALLEAKDGAESAVELRRFSARQPSQVAAWTQFQIARLEGDEAARNEAARAVLTAGPHPSAPLCGSVAAAQLA
jgi:hypothetical protein